MISLILIILLGGCASLTTFQTAQVLEEGKTDFGVAIAYSNIVLDDSSLFFEETEYRLPEIFYRRPLNNRFELGLKFYPFSIGGDIKYQFIDGKAIDMAADFGIDYTGLEISVESNGEKSESKTRLINLYPTILLTYNITKKINITLAPKVIMQYLTTNNENSRNFMPGFTINMSLGPLMSEVGYYRSTREGITFYSAGLAIH